MSEKLPIRDRHEPIDVKNLAIGFRFGLLQEINLLQA